MELWDAVPVERVQRGVLTRQQAVARFGRAAVRRHLAAGRWVVLGRRVVVLHNGPLLPEQTLWAALLLGPRGAVLGSWSALSFDGLALPQAFPAHLVIPDGARRPVLPEPFQRTLITRSALLGPDDVHPGRAPPRTRPARSLVDAASLAEQPGRARLALLQGVQAGITSPAELGAALERRGPCRHRHLLRETVADIDGGVRSVPEQRFSAVVREAGLPPPARQAVVRGPGGRYYLDADWPEFAVSAEVHGAHHQLARQLENDWRRHNDLTAMTGRRVLHFTSYQVRHAPQEVATTLKAALSPRR